jgi:hypothetical protein
MMQKPIDLKGKKVIRSIELHKDLKPDAIRRMLSELSAEASSASTRKKILLVLYSE